MKNDATRAPGRRSSLAAPLPALALLTLASLPFAGVACDLLKKEEPADAAPPATATVIVPIAPAAPPPSAPALTATLAPAPGTPPKLHTVKLADGGTAVVIEAGVPFTLPAGFPTTLPSGFPTAMPSGFPTAMPAGFPTALPSGFPTAFPGFPPPDAGK
jgi:hypothetical protein